MSEDVTNVRLTAGAGPGKHKLEIQAPNGEWVDISGCVQGTTTRIDAGDVARMDVRLAVLQGYHEGVMRLLIPRETVRLLRAFGWAPPEGGVNSDGSCTMRMDHGAWAAAWGMQ